MIETLFKQIFDERLQIKDGTYSFNDETIKYHNNILRFTPDISYSSGNFSKLRERHAQLQLDSVNGTQDRLNTILERTQWPREFFKDKLILECGCGAGADTEVLLKLGATVVSVDIAGVDICRANLNNHSNSVVIQASIMDMPFRKQAFDIVWCHRVLQHTPSPTKTLAHILQFVKPEGAVFVHSYSQSLRELLSWKYALRPFTRKMDSEKLYHLVEKWTPPMYRFTNWLRARKPDGLGRFLFKIAHQVVPIRNYRFTQKFANKDDRFLLEYSVHDTFDCLSPRYDRPLSQRTIRKIAGHLKQDFEVVETGVTLLRTIPDKEEFVETEAVARTL